MQSPRLDPETTPAYAFARQQNLERVQRLRAEEVRREAEKQQLEAQHLEELARRQYERETRLLQVAEAQRQQMQVELARRRRVPQQPAISPEFCGYPHIPQTPAQLRRSRKLEQQARLKAELEAQIRQKQEVQKATRASDMQFAASVIMTAEMLQHSEAAEERSRKEQQRSQLWRSWKEAESLRQEQRLILAERSPSQFTLQTPALTSPSQLKDVTLTISTPVAISLSPRLKPANSERKEWRKSLALRLKQREEESSRRSLEAQRNSQRRRLLKAAVMTSRRGALIVLEGLDHCGKSSQARLLQQALPGSQLASFPDRTTALGQIISQYLRRETEQDDHTIHLLFSANRWERIPAIRALLEGGSTVILDRYVYSGCTYSAAKGLPLDWCKAPDRGLIQPDLVVYLKMSAAQAAARSGFGEERYERLSFQERVGQFFDEVLLPLSYCMTLDASSDVDSLAGQIKAKAEEVAARVQSEPLRFL